MEINSVIHGFKVINVSELPDVKGTMNEMVHEKTGAKLAWLDREDDNKTFSIAFKTIPENDTGVFHILEHSCLNGSKKYPCREPFVELLKGSMQTFLNALTFPDKTMYPVSSRNKKDFMNLMSVYMDAVFHPSIYTNPNIFYQEGWHYEIRNKEDEPVYKGVVLNEMKGAFSSVDEIMINELNRMLFSDNCYQYVSGGDPEHITDLSYEKFIETHQKFYHPSNSRIFLDGSIDIDEVLKFIDEEYFSQYENEDMDFSIPMQEEKDPLHHTVKYEVSPDEPTENRTQIALARLISSYDNPMKNLAWGLLSTLLVSSNESILKKLIIDNGLGEDVELDIYDGIQQPWIVMCVRNTQQDKYEEVLKVIKQAATTLVNDGLDHEALQSMINQAEFKYREKHEPAGVMFAQRALESWLYDGDITQGFSLGKVFEELRNKVDEGYFEELIKEFFLEDHLSTLIAIPDSTLGEEREKHEAEKLHEAKVSWKEDIDKYISINEKLDTWQATPDTPEQINSLPKLTLDDISKTPIEYPYVVKRVLGSDVLVHPAGDTGIVYMHLYFNLAGITKDKLPYLSLFTGLLTSLPTKNKSVEQLQSAIRKDLGSLNFYLDAFTCKHEYDACYPVLCVSASSLQKNVNKAVELILEVIQETVFDSEKILPLVKQDNESFRQALSAAGHSIAMKRSSAKNSADGVFREYTSGYEAGLFEKQLEKNYESMIDEVINEFGLYQEILFSKARCTASITGEENLNVIEDIISKLSSVDAEPGKVHYPLMEDENEFIQIPGGVSYCAMSKNIEALGCEVPPELSILSQLLTFDYLWNEVRVKGGAYGTGFSVGLSGNVGAYSYRDPDALHTLDAFHSIPQRIEELKTSQEDLTQMIIGTIASSEPLLAENGKIRVGDRFYFSHITDEERKTNREKRLNCTAETLGAYYDVLNQAINQASLCVVGNEETYKQLKDNRFKKLETL